MVSEVGFETTAAVATGDASGFAEGEAAAAAFVDSATGDEAGVGAGAGWISGKYFDLSSGDSVSASYSMTPVELLHFSFAPSLSMDSKVSEDPLAKDRVMALVSVAPLACRGKEKRIARGRRKKPKTVSRAATRRDFMGFGGTTMTRVLA
jgi:hypothetical protein